MNTTTPHAPLPGTACASHAARLPDTVGTAKTPTLQSPANACDSHIHVFDQRFMHVGSSPIISDDSTADHYRAFQQRIGTQRVVVVTPRAYGTDNSVTLDAICRLGRERARGVAAVTSDVTDGQLETLHSGGIRGIRFTLYRPEHAVTNFAMVEALARRVHELGWHVQLHWTADQIVQHTDLLLRLPSTIVFDHLARLPLPAGTSHPAFHVVRHLLDGGRTWIKLSGPYLDSQSGAADGYADLDGVIESWVEAAPERLVWGSDWPHATETVKPDDAMLFDLLRRWTGSPSVLEQVLVTNPAQLYEFGT
ncbi:amidohydrolase family protein [Burkholderia singularis]|uniref:amidohydrolase family protein n=1 Tax=Burkholderia singularis TaxID=1503053 RepID=UPI0009E7B4E3|nr:amidohydrolase family protein [Burkholderia singularis]